MSRAQPSLTRSNVGRPSLPISLSGHILGQLGVRVELSAVNHESLVLDQKVHDKRAARGLRDREGASDGEGVFGFFSLVLVGSQIRGIGRVIEVLDRECELEPREIREMA